MKEKLTEIARKIIVLSLLGGLTDKQIFTLTVELLDREASKIEREELGYD